MRRFWIYLLAVVLVAAAVVTVTLARHHTGKHDDKKTNTPTAQSSPSKPPARNACTIFTLADAKQLLGDSAKGGINPVYNSSTDFDISTCTYTQDQGANAPVSSKQSATLLMQLPKTSIGNTSNQKQFGELKPTGVQDIQGYGAQAYWDGEHGQLNILKNNTWYILSFGPTTPADRTLDQTKQLADLIIGKM